MLIMLKKSWSDVKNGRGRDEQEAREFAPTEKEVQESKERTTNSFVFNFASLSAQLQRRVAYALLGIPEVSHAHPPTHLLTRSDLDAMVISYRPPDIHRHPALPGARVTCSRILTQTPEFLLLSGNP